MTHADVLKMLFPLPLEGDFDDDVAIEGKHLDAANDSADLLLVEMYPDQAYETLLSWERVYGLIPAADDPLQARRNAVIRKMRAKGGLSLEYFISLAAYYKWTITIDVFCPFMAGWSRAGDSLYVAGSIWQWRVNVPGHAIYNFRAGESAAGERLCWWTPNTVLEEMFNAIKPAHTAVIYSYD